MDSRLKNALILTILVFFILFALTGCFGKKRIMPVTMNFPQAPEPLLLKPEVLDPLPEDAEELSDILNNTTVNYGKYRQLQLKIKEWQKWYNTQNRIHRETTKDAKKN